MKNNRIALSISLVLALAGASSSAVAGVQVYGSYELGRLDSSNDADTLVPFAYDANVAGKPVKYVGHGDGMNHDLRLGMKFSVPVFVEFGTGAENSPTKCNSVPKASVALATSNLPLA